jgi:hypothetical protein
MLSDFVTAELSIGTTTIPTPPVEFELKEIPLPDIPSIPGPGIQFDGVVQDIPDIRFNPDPISVPLPELGTQELDLDETPAIPVPDINFPELDFKPLTIPVGFTEVTVPRLDTLELRGGGFELRDGPTLDLGTVTAPDFSVETVPVALPSFVQELPRIVVPEFALPSTLFGGVELPNVTVPTGAELAGEQQIPSLDQSSVDVELRTDKLRRFILRDVPSGLLTDPLGYVGEQAFSFVEANITSVLARRIKAIVNGFLDLLLAEDTKQRLRDRGDDG